MSATVFGQDQFVSINDLQFHYVAWGNPEHPAMVLLHGFQSHAHTWDAFNRVASAF